MTPAGPPDREPGAEPSIFDEDAAILRRERRREKARIRSVLLTSGVLILLPSLIRITVAGSLAGAPPLFWAYAVVVTVVYIILGRLAMRKPFTALLCGLAIFAALQAAIIWNSPSMLYHGWLFRGIVLLNLIMPLQKARALQAAG